MVFACLAFNPQLGVLVPLAFIAGREWRAFARASVGVIALALVGVITAMRGQLGTVFDRIRTALT